MAVNDTIPKSRITLTYRTDVRGEKEEVNLPFRLLIMGDMSAGKSTDRKLDLDQRRIRNIEGSHLTEMMADMNISIETEVQNRIDPQNGDTLKVSIPITSMRSFDPYEVAQHVPKIKSLLLLKSLLLELQGDIDNRKQFRRAMRTVALNKDNLVSLRAELGDGFSSFVLPAKTATAADAEASETVETNEASTESGEGDAES